MIIGIIGIIQNFGQPYNDFPTGDPRGLWICFSMKKMYEISFSTIFFRVKSFNYQTNANYACILFSIIGTLSIIASMIIGTPLLHGSEKD